jgi:hypothetical protein
MSAILGVGGVEEVHLAQRVHRHVLQVGVRLGGRVVDGRLVPRVQAERLGEAAVLRGVDLAARHERDEVVLGGLAAELGGERRGRLPGAGQADDEHPARAAGDRDDLAPRVQRQAAAVVDDVVPHPQAALLRLTEVVGVEHPGDVGVQVDRDDAVVRVTGGGQVRRVDDRGVGLPAIRVVVLARRVVQLLLHPGHVGVGRLHDQPGAGAELRVRPDVAVHDDHVGAGDVGILLGGDAVVFRPGNRLLGCIGRILDYER